MNKMILTRNERSQELTAQHGGRCTQSFGWVDHNAFGPTNNWPVCSLVKLV